MQWNQLINQNPILLIPMLTIKIPNKLKNRANPTPNKPKLISSHTHTSQPLPNIRIQYPINLKQFIE